jgi:chaperone BCS1
MKVIVVRNDDKFLMILEYLHYHMDTTYLRELIRIDNTIGEPRYMIAEPSFEWNGIIFKIIKNEVYKKNSIEFYCYSELIIEHISSIIITTFIQDAIKYISEKKYALDKLCVYKSYYQSWDFEIELNQKNMNKIYLNEKTKNDILNDITNFSKKEVIERYNQLNINHTRIYMFYGPPGTGKTSLIKGLATHFKKNICYLNISNDLEDNQLKKCIRNIPNNSILCLEDIDSLFGENRKSKNSLTFSGFINIFDGFATPQNLLVFLTTNHLPQLEQAVIRRISYFIEFKYATKEEIKQMFCTFFPTYSDQFEIFYNNIGDIDITINILEKFFIKYLFDDIIKQSKNFAKFANGELKVELNNCSKLYI